MWLWHMRSEVLQGFYSSDVYVAAYSRAYAVMQAMKAYDRYVSSYIEEMGFHPLSVSAWPDNEDFQKESLAKLNEFEAELNQNLERLEHQALIVVQS